MLLEYGNSSFEVLAEFDVGNMGVIAEYIYSVRLGIWLMIYRWINSAYTYSKNTSDTNFTSLRIPKKHNMFYKYI